MSKGVYLYLSGLLVGLVFGLLAGGGFIHMTWTADMQLHNLRYHEVSP